MEATYRHMHASDPPEDNLLSYIRMPVVNVSSRLLPCSSFSSSRVSLFLLTPALCYVYSEQSPSPDTRSDFV